VGAQLSGRVAFIAVSVNDTVENGDLLARIE
jgi:multidrug resistance efflux pump